MKNLLNFKQRASQTNAVYLVHGKFSYLVNDNPFDMVIFSHCSLSRSANDAKFIGKVMSVPSATNNGLKLSVTVSEYIRKGVLYFDVLDFSFGGIRSNDLVRSYNPWSTKDTTKTKSSVANVHKNYTKSKRPTPPTVPPPSLQKK